MKIGVKWGVILGVAICVWTLILHVLGWYTTDLAAGERADIAAIILPVLAITFAILERRRANPGHTLAIGDGLSTGMVVGIVSIPISAAFLWYYHHHVNPEWVQHLVDYHTAALTASGASASVIAAKVDALRNTGRDGSQLAGALIGTTIISAIISLVASLVLRRKAA